MVTFNDTETLAAIQHKKICNGINTAFLTFLFITAVILAVCSRYAESNFGLFAGGLCLWGVLLCAYLVSLFAITLPAGRKLKYRFCKIMAEGLLSREEMLKRGEHIELIADYSGNILTLTRKNYTGEIVISPAKSQSELKLGETGAKTEFDLTPFKTLPSVYATAGANLLKFLRAYYSLHGKENKNARVTITDNMEKAPVVFEIFSDREPDDKILKTDYFIKKGLVK